MNKLKNYFLAGLLIWLPIMVTVFVVSLLVGVLDSVINLLPPAYQPAGLLGVHIPGLGVLVSLVVILLTGLVATNFFGKKLVQWIDKFIDRIPVIRTVYSSTKQVMETMMSSNGDSFRTVLLVEYPRQGVWTIGFQTNANSPSIGSALSKEMVTVFIPTTPNPTSGFIVLFAKSDVIELDMTVEQALKYVVSLGTLQ